MKKVLILFLLFLYIRTSSAKSGFKCPRIPPRKVDFLLERLRLALVDCPEPGGVERALALYSRKFERFSRVGYEKGLDKLKESLDVLCSKRPPDGIIGLNVTVKQTTIIGNTVYFTSIVSGDSIKDYITSGSVTFCKGKVRVDANTFDLADLELVP